MILWPLCIKVLCVNPALCIRALHFYLIYKCHHIVVKDAADSVWHRMKFYFKTNKDTFKSSRLRHCSKTR